MSQNTLQHQLSLHTGCPDTKLIRRDFCTKSSYKHGINIPKLFNLSTEYIFDRFLELKGRFFIIRINTQHRDNVNTTAQSISSAEDSLLRHCDVPHTVFSRTPSVCLYNVENIITLKTTVCVLFIYFKKFYYSNVNSYYKNISNKNTGNRE